MANRVLRYDFLNNPKLTDHDTTAVPGFVSTTPDLSLTRATIAKERDADGWLREFQSGEARMRGATFRQGLSAYSETIGATLGWNATGSVVADSTDVSPPSGVTTIQKFDTDGLVASGVNSVTSNLAFAAFRSQHTYVLSCYARAGTNDWFSIQVVSLGAIIINGYFDLTNGVVGASVGADTVDLGMEDAGDGWYRCWIAFTNTTTDESGQIRLYNAEGDGDISWPDKSLAGYIYVGGFMTEDVSGRWDGRNEVTRSNDMNNGVWTHSGSLDNMTVGTGTLPNSGPTTYWEMEDFGTGSGASAYYNNVVLPSAGRYIFSGYVRKNSDAPSSTDFAALSISNLGVTTVTVSYDLTTGATNIIVGSPASYGSEDVGNGWWRIWIEYYANSNDLNGTHWVYQTATNSSLTYTRDGSKMDVAGFQTEPKKPNVAGPSAYVGTDAATDVSYSPSDYITTTTVAVTELSGTSSPGCLIESSRTNICLQSEDFSTTWLELSGASTFNQTIAPDGSLTADKLLDSGATGSGNVAFYQGITVSNATAYTFSVFLKADQLTWAQLYMNQAVDPYCYFDLANGATGTAANNDDAGIEDYGNGWYRCWISFTTDDTTVTTQIRCADADNDASVALDSTSSIFVWGAMLEAGSKPSAYISTTTGTATRNADDINSTDVTWYNETEGSLYIKATPGKVASGINYIAFTVGDGTGTVKRIQSGQFYQTYSQFVLDTSTQVNTTIGSATEGTEFQAAMRFKANDFQGYFDGVAATPDTSGTMPSGLDNFNVGSLTNETLHYNGYIAAIDYYDEGLTEHQLYEASLGNDPLAPLDTPELTAHWDFSVASRGLNAIVGPNFGITRATAAWDTDADGYIREYQAGEPRFPGATFTENLFAYAIDLDTNFINKTRTTITSGKADPFGGTDAWGLNEDGTAASTHILQTPSGAGSVSNNQEVTFSVYAKASNRSWIQLGMTDDGGSSRSVNYDLANGVIGAVSAEITETGIIDIGDGWYRCWYSLEVQSNFAPRIFIADGNNGATFDGLSQESVILYGVQAERVNGRASRAPTALIATSGVPESAVSGTGLGTRGEQAATNICLQSEDFSTTWISDATTPTASAGTAPDGSNTATDVIHTGTGELKQTMTVTADTVYTFSVFVHSGTTGTHDWVKLRYRDSGAANGIDAWFDLTSSAAVGTSQTFGAGTTLTGTKTEDYGNGWYRISLTGQLASGITGGRVEIYNTTTDGGETREQTNSTWVWGAMLEAVSSTTSYIPTTTTSQTRNQDIVTVADVGFMGDQTEGTFYIKATLDPGHIGGLNVPLVAGQGGAASNSMYISDNGGAARVDHNSAAGNDGLILQNGAITAGTEFQIATAFQQDELNGYVDGTQMVSIGPDTTVTCPTTGLFDEISLFDHPDVGDWEFNGIITEVRFYNKFISTELSDLSTGVFPSFGGGRTLTRPLTRDLTRELTRAKADS